MKEAFGPYIEPVIAQISPNLSQKPNAETLPVFCTSLRQYSNKFTGDRSNVFLPDTLASVCRAVGTDHCKTILRQALDFSVGLYNEINEPEFRSAVFVLIFQIHFSVLNMISSTFSFALAGAASRILKNELNADQINHIMKYLFDSMKSLDWIEVKEHDVDEIFIRFLFFRMQRRLRIDNSNGSMKKKSIETLEKL